MLEPSLRFTGGNYKNYLTKSKVAIGGRGYKWRITWILVRGHPRKHA